MSDKVLPSTFVPGFSLEDVVRKVPYKQLGETELLVSRLSFGCSSISHGVRFTSDGILVPVNENEPLSTAISLVEEAVRSGINYFDTAPFYGAGKSEIVLGECLSRLPRESFYVATKLGRNELADFNYSATETRRLVLRSIEKLKVSYLDVAQVHDVEFADIQVVLQETLPTLDALRQEGKIRHIGITGYPLGPLKEILTKSSVKIDLVLSYCRETLFNHDLREYIPFFREKKLGIINAAVHGMSLLTDQPLPDWHAAGQDIREACVKAKKFCQDKGVSLTRLTMGAAFAFSEVDTILTGMKTKEILHDNLDVLINGLSKTEIECLNVIEKEIMSQLSTGHWEGVELATYRSNPRAFCDNLRLLHGSA